MKFAVKIFAVAYFAVVVTFGLGGCAMLEAGFQQSLAARQQQAASSNDALCAAYHTVSQAGLPAYLAEGFRKQVSSDAGGSTTAVGGPRCRTGQASSRPSSWKPEAGGPV
mgnify:CR=1 FL=1